MIYYTIIKFKKMFNSTTTKTIGLPAMKSPAQTSNSLQHRVTSRIHPVRLYQNTHVVRIATEASLCITSDSQHLDRLSHSFSLAKRKSGIFKKHIDCIIHGGARASDPRERAYSARAACTCNSIAARSLGCRSTAARVIYTYIGVFFFLSLAADLCVYCGNVELGVQ